jgi:transcriptional regulator with XRE-family HTH domain
MAAAQRQKLEGLCPRMAKAVNKVEWRAQVGHAIARTFALAGVSQKEAAALLDRDPAQIARWIASSERPSMDLIFSVRLFRGPLVIALSELAGEAVDVTTHVTIRRSA